jgi:proteasome lid subunit RPN8/RPN11
MLPYSSEIRLQIEALADENPDEEICGAVCVDPSGMLTVAPLQNVAGDTANYFAFDRKAYDALSDNGMSVQSVYHSHVLETQPAELSYMDINTGRALMNPIAMFHRLDRVWDFYDPAGLNPFPLQPRIGQPTDLEFYLGWRWVWARADCYTLLRNFYRGFLNIELPDFDRAPEPAIQLRGGAWATFTEYMPQIGFVEIDPTEPLRLYDVPIMAIESEIPHHCGVIVEVGDRPVLLHLLNGDRLSETRVYGGHWQEVARFTFRHEAFL